MFANRIETNWEVPCPLKRALSLLEGKYSVYILLQLVSGPKRYSELKKCIPGITPKTLSERLRFYVDQGIIVRHSYPVIPPRVEYTLTEKGQAFQSVLRQLQIFGSFDAETGNS